MAKNIQDEITTKRHYSILYAVFKGAKGYFNDLWHDWLLKHLEKYHGGNLFDRTACNGEAFCWCYRRKEGSLWFYIKQIRIGQHISQKRQKQAEIDNILYNEKLWGDKTEEEIREDVYAMVDGLTDTKKTKYVRKRGKDDRHRKSIKHR